MPKRINITEHSVWLHENFTKFGSFFVYDFVESIRKNMFTRNPLHIVWVDGIFRKINEYFSMRRSLDSIWIKFRMITLKMRYIL